MVAVIEGLGTRRRAAEVLGISERRLRILMRGWNMKNGERYPVTRISYLLAQQFVLRLDLVMADIWTDVYGLPD